MILQIEDMNGKIYEDGVSRIMISQSTFKTIEEASNKFALSKDGYMCYYGYDLKDTDPKNRGYKAISYFKNKDIHWIITNAIFYVLNDNGKTINICGWHK